MDNAAKTHLFEDMPIPKAVMTLALPAVATTLVTMLYNLSDTYFVGILDDPVQNAAVTLAAPVILAFNAVNNLFGVGSSSMMSRALGRKDYETVRRSSAFGFYCALCAGLLFSLFCTVLKGPLLTILGTVSENREATDRYMFWTVTCGAAPAICNVVMAYLVKSEGSALHAGIGTMSGCLLNIILDPIFILPWGLDMGSAGAGCATFLANCAACLYFLILLFVKRKSTYVSVDPRYFSFKKAIVVGVCAVGIPAAIQNLLNVTGMTILNNFTSSYDPDDSTAVAAMGIAQKLNMIPLYIAMGVSQGIMPIISYNFASKNYARMKNTLLFAAKVSLAILVTGSLIYLIAARGLVWLFMKNESIVDYGSRFLRGMCLGTPFLCIDFLAVGVFQSCGMGSKSLIFAILRKLVLEIPALIILNKLFPLYGLAYAQFTAEFILSIAAVVVLARLFRRLEREKAQEEAEKAAVSGNAAEENT